MSIRFVALFGEVRQLGGRSVRSCGYLLREKCIRTESTLFSTGIIFKPRSLAMWNTEIDCAWTP
jgi:hypothetical protein